MWFQRFLLGGDPVAEPAKRKIVLSGYLFALYLGVDIFFALVNLFNQEGEPMSLVTGAGVELCCLLLLRKRWIDTAVAIHLLRSIGIAFYFIMIDEDAYQTGTFLYFIPSSLGALAIYGYRELWKGLLFTGLSLTLFLVGMFDPSRFHASNAHFYFIVNFAVVLTIGILLMVYYDWHVVHSEDVLQKKNDELKKANEELDRFIYSASHDLRAPISSLLGLVNLMKIGPREEQDQIMGMIEDRVKRMEAFTREVIDFERNARGPIQTTNVEVKRLVTDCFNRVRYAVGASRVELRLEMDENLTVLLDYERFRLVVENLLSNSVKYSNPTLPDAHVLVSAVRQNGELIMSVRDNGIGIAPEYRPRVFEMFFRAHESSEGSGLGLYIVKETLDKLGGQVELSSVQYEGTSVKVRIPIG
jgi:signal transduction histidine kinase